MEEQHFGRLDLARVAILMDGVGCTPYLTGHILRLAKSETGTWPKYTYIGRINAV